VVALRRATLAALAGGFGAAGLLDRIRRPRRAPPAPDRVRRVLVIRLDLLGDVVMSLPAVRALRVRYPQAHLTMLVLPFARGLLEGCPDLDDTLTLDTNALRRPLSLARALPDLLRTLRDLRRRRFDVIVSLSGRTAGAVALLAGAPCRVGYAGEGYPFAFTLPVPGYRFHRPAHEVEYDLALTRALGCPEVERRPRLVVPAWADAFVAGLLPQDGAPLVALHPGATNGSAKRWPTARWAALASELVGAGRRVALVGSAGDRALTQPIARQATQSGAPPGAVLDLAGRTPHLLHLAALLARASALVSGDSGPVHIAVAVGCPVVELFGPTDPRTYGPLDPEAVVLRQPLPCSPCYDNTRPAECPFGNPACMQLFPVEQVRRAVERTLARRAAVAEV
jgi:lipopolysaccharide heptosyltransferase II